MTWIVGIVSLGVLLAVLSIEPSQLMQINASIHHQQWQLAGYVLLALAIGLYLIQRYFYVKASGLSKNQFSHHLTQHNSLRYSSSALTQPNTTLVIRTPINLLRQQGLSKLLLLFFCACIFWMSIFCHGLSQRIKMLQVSPTHTVYVEATVTPIGLSDKRLKIRQANNVHNAIDGSATSNLSTNNASDNKPNNVKTEPLKVEQGYRQLVQLSNIEIYGSELLDNSKSNSKTDNINAHGQLIAKDESNDTDSSTDNPFSGLLKTDDLKRSSKPSPNTHSLSTLIDKQDVTTVLLQVYQKDDDWINNLSPDKSTRLILRLNPLEFKRNLKPQEFNEYRWLRSRHAIATAHIVSSKSISNHHEFQPLKQLTVTQKVNQYRFELRQHFLALSDINQWQQERTTFRHKDKFYAYREDTATDGDSVAVILSLLTGDRSLISSDMTAAYRFAGISHLLAISGTHVLFLAMLSATLMTFVINRLYPKVYRVVPRWQCAFVVAVIVAFIYALFAGFDIPAVRTAFMLLIVGIVRYLLVPSATLKVLLGLAIAMAWQDIFVLWQAGFWLSFIAVAALVVYSRRWSHKNQSKHKLNQPDKQASLLGNVKYHSVELLKLQFWISVALLPLSLWLFGEVSLWGFVVNIFAIGFFGWIIVPLNLLAGVIYSVFPWLADKIWQLLFWVLEYFHDLLLWLQSTANQLGWLRTEMSVLIMVLLLLIAVPWMLPKGIVNRLLSLPAVLLFGVLCLTGFSNSVVDANDESKVSITELTTQRTDNSAVLISVNGLVDNEYWLLLSAYPKPYHSHQTASQSEQIAKLSEHLYKQLDIKGIHSLTGVIVQTSSPQLSKVVIGLREHLPISYYWQAGLTQHLDEINSYLTDSRLTAQHCQAGKRWAAVSETESGSESKPNAINKNNAAGFELTALTGWSVSEDVSDCAIQVSSAYPITVSYIDQDTQQVPYSSALIYTSAQPSLMALWKMLCLSYNELGSTSTAMSYQNQHWITSPHVDFDTQTIDDIKPVTWYILHSDRQQAPKVELLETHLYWQQQYAK